MASRCEGLLIRNTIRTYVFFVKLFFVMDSIKNRALKRYFGLGSRVSLALLTSFLRRHWFARRQQHITSAPTVVTRQWVLRRRSRAKADGRKV